MILKKWHQCFLPILTITILLMCYQSSFAQDNASINNTNPNPKSSIASSAVTGGEEEKSIEVKDPYEKFNRVMFKFNDIVDKLVLKPLAELYNKIIPKPLAKGLTNFYNNIDMVPTILNDLMQANFYQAVSDTWRLGINSTIGIVGLFDVASRIGLEPNSEDFGLTLARWGYTNSNYLVLPFLGPTTIRDGIFGFPINYYFLTIYPYIYPARDRYILYFSGVLVRRADLLHYEDLMEQIALDRYIFLRSAFMQHRNYLIERNKQLGNPYFEKNKLEESASSLKAEVNTDPK